MERFRIPIKREHVIAAGVVAVLGMLAYFGIREGLTSSQERINATIPPPGLVETFNNDISGGIEGPQTTPGAENGIFYPITGVTYPKVPSLVSNLDYRCVQVPRGGTVFGGVTALGEDPSVYNDVLDVQVYPVTAAGPQPPVSFTTQMMPPSTLNVVWPGTVVCGK